MEGPITDAVADRLITRILQLEARDINADIGFFLKGPGGELKPGLAIYDAMRFTACDVVTVCVGHTASMAALLLAAGTPGKRVALSAGRITLHPPCASLFDHEAASHEAGMGQINALVYQTLAHLTGRPPSAVESDARRGLTLTPAEACTYGFIDYVDELPPPT